MASHLGGDIFSQKVTFGSSDFCALSAFAKEQGQRDAYKCKMGKGGGYNPAGSGLIVGRTINFHGRPYKVTRETLQVYREGWRTVLPDLGNPDLPSGGRVTVIALLFMTSFAFLLVGFVILTRQPQPVMSDASDLATSRAASFAFAKTVIWYLGGAVAILSFLAFKVFKR